ncbi:MAG: hypothetical protein RL095_1688 [Verrucomicrobiota bacterium]|jgi:hypothetical protein
MTYEIPPYKDAEGFWSFHTPRLRYPQPLDLVPRHRQERDGSLDLTRKHRL